MAGFLDGEGWLSTGPSAGFGQNPGMLLDRAVALCERNGLPVTLSANKQGCVRVLVNGTKGSLRLLGTFRPLRLMGKARQAWEGRKAYGGGPLASSDIHAEVLSVRPVGVRQVVGIQTSTGTFIAEGLLSHNSQVQRLVQLACELDGRAADMRDVLTSTDPAINALVSHEGALLTTRQPGVEQSGGSGGPVASGGGGNVTVNAASNGSQIASAMAWATGATVATFFVQRLLQHIFSRGAA